MSQNVQIRGKDSNKVAQVDNLSGYLITIGELHARIHEGVFYQGDHVVLALADAADIEVLIKVGATDNAHMRFRAAADGQLQLELFEGTTISADGTIITGFNRNRRSPNTPAVGTFHTPTVTADGTKIANNVTGGGSAGEEGGVVGGQQDSFEEWILDQDTNYLLRVTNISGAAVDALVALDWYETS